MKRYALLFAFVVSALAAADAFDLRQAMGEERFLASGLDKLSSEELAVLSGAVADMLGRQEESVRQLVKEEVREEVRSEVEEELQIPKGDDRFGIESVKNRVQDIFKRDTPEVIESRILGEFNGWGGKTRFRLENGQVWQQTQADTFVVRVKDPVVRIRRGTFGGYLLKIQGYNSSVRVERIE